MCFIEASSICNFDSFDNAFFSNIFNIKSTLSQAFALIGFNFSFIA
jgi:hypothetical protein